MKSVGLILVGIWLVFHSFKQLTPLHFAYDTTIDSLLALTTGLLLILHEIKMKLSDWGRFLLSIWLLLHSSMDLFKISFHYSATVLELLGLAAGLMLVLRK